MHALWDRYRPRTAADWRRTARAVLRRPGPRYPSPLFGALLEAEKELGAADGWHDNEEGDGE